MMEKRNRTYNLINNEMANEIMKYLLILGSIVFSRDTLVTSITLGFYKSSFFYGVFIVIVVGYFLFNNRRNFALKSSATRGIGIFLGLLIVTSIIKLDFQIYIFSIIFYISVAYFFVYIFTFEDFFEKLTNIMVILGVFSLITCYVLKPMLFPNGVANANIPIVVNSAGLKFFNLGVSYVVAESHYVRNFGIFREPGVYQFFILIPFIYQLLITDKSIKWFKILILTITLISTFSMTGIIVMSLFILIYIIKLIVEKKMTKRIVMSISIIFAISIIIFGVLYFNNINFKLVVNETTKKLVTTNDSTSTRKDSILNNIKLFAKSPIWGNDFSRVQGASIHNTNTTFSLFAIFGIFVGSMSIFYQWVFSKNISKNNLVRVLVLLALILLVNSQFLVGNTVFWIFLFSIYMQ